MSGVSQSQGVTSKVDPTTMASTGRFKLGYVDSVGFAELLAFLDEEFDMKIPWAEILTAPSWCRRCRRYPGPPIATRMPLSSGPTI
jgi:acyl carrier protein